MVAPHDLSTIRSLNNKAEEPGLTSYTNLHTATQAVRKYGIFGGSVALMPRGFDGRIVVFIINPKDPGDVIHGSPFVAWS